MSCKERLPIVIALMLALFAVDASIGPELSPWIAYAVPVVLASRHCGLSTGGMYALLAVASQSLALLVIAWLTARLSFLERALREIRT